MAAFSAKRERPSELSEEVKETENVKMQRIRIPPLTTYSMLLESSKICIKGQISTEISLKHQSFLLEDSKYFGRFSAGV